jgi:hypothetical protein
MADETITLTLSRRDAYYAVEHLRLVADADQARDGTHAAARMSTRFVAEQIEKALATD